VWAKQTRTGRAWQFAGGKATRKGTEFCLLFLRGKLGRKSGSLRQLIVAPVRKEYQKPDEAYPRIEQLVDGPYLELFARRRWPGWDAWGDQADLFDQGSVATRRWSSSTGQAHPSNLNSISARAEKEGGKHERDFRSDRGRARSGGSAPDPESLENAVHQVEDFDIRDDDSAWPVIEQEYDEAKQALGWAEGKLADAVLDGWTKACRTPRSRRRERPKAGCKEGGPQAVLHLRLIRVRRRCLISVAAATMRSERSIVASIVRTIVANAGWPLNARSTATSP
jgi:hypothetical protein